MGLWGFMTLVSLFCLLFGKNKLQGWACRQKQSDPVSARLKGQPLRGKPQPRARRPRNNREGGHHLETVHHTEDSEAQAPPLVGAGLSR